jgi:hypothetical protein
VTSCSVPVAADQIMTTRICVPLLRENARWPEDGDHV